MVANSDNTDQIFLRELSVLDYLFAISSQPLNLYQTANALDCNFPEHIVLTQIRPFHQEHSDHCLHYLPYKDYLSHNSSCLSK